MHLHHFEEENKIGIAKAKLMITNKWAMFSSSSGKLLKKFYYTVNVRKEYKNLSKLYSLNLPLRSRPLKKERNTLKQSTTKAHKELFHNGEGLQMITKNFSRL